MAQMSIKKTLAKMLQWMKTPVVLRNTANSEPMYKAKRADTGVQVDFGVGSGGYTHGVYSRYLGKWLIHGDASTSNIYINNNVKITQTAFTGSLDSTTIGYGIYRLESASSYTPGNITSQTGSTPSWCMFIQTDVYRTQIIIDGSIGIFIRKYTGNPASWGTWKKIT